MVPNTSLPTKKAARPGLVQDTSKTSAQTLTLDTTVVHFIRKEVIYTKLKYSRCPQYDIVSGGLAALLSAFIGFLISEKFGLELVDSGDFYIAFMYGVFLIFSCRPLIKLVNTFTLDYHFFSLRPGYLFYQDLALKLCQCGPVSWQYYTTFQIPGLSRVTRALYQQEQVSVW
jgi:hypothetical protein